ncbi:MAG: MaoC/PaaZ C-terminal domain-containing protein [Caulobacter sp.]|nr:MaoC/PaaZ C-terminal domain-containing protein [Caulobacter sp.]
MLPEVGAVHEHPFVIDQAAMEAFATLSGDRSAIHTDEAYARAAGYRGVIVYGGLMLAQLSHVVGNHLPGSKGVSMHWSIDYRQPLFVDEPAVLRLEVVHVSEPARVLSGKFTIQTADRTIATGKTQSLVPQA